MSKRLIEMMDTLSSRTLRKTKVVNGQKPGLIKAVSAGPKKKASVVASNGTSLGTKR